MTDTTPDPDRTTSSHRPGLSELVQTALGPRYGIIRELGRGGMAVVYLAENHDLDRLVAIKVLRPDKVYDDGVINRFRAEATSIARLRHPHIVAVHSRGEHGSILWFEMDYIEGGSIEDRLAQGPLPQQLVARYLAQAADALACAHSHGIIHRDIKPSNLLIVAGSDHVVITDFGIAKIIGQTTLTETGMTVGTVAYMSPEQLSAEPHLTGSADQYSLGVVAYECLVGKRPYDGQSPSQLMASQFSRGAPRILLQFSDCLPDLATLVDRMLATDGDDRWPDLAFVQRAAEEIAFTGEARCLRAASPPRKRASLRRKRTAQMLTTIGVVALAATAGVAWYRRAPALVPRDPQTSATMRHLPLSAPADTIHPPGTVIAPARLETPHDSATTKHLSPPRPKPVDHNPANHRIASGGPAPTITVPTGHGATDNSSGTTDPLASAQTPATLISPPPPPPPIPTTATLTIMSVVPGTFVYVGNDSKPYTAEHGVVDITVTPGTVHIRVTSNQPGCKSIEDDLSLAPGEHKTVRRNPDCPGQ